MNLLSDDYDYVAHVTDRVNHGIIAGRPARGVAIMWKKCFSTYIRANKINDRIITVDISYSDKSILLINVYMPFDG